MKIDITKTTPIKVKRMVYELLDIFDSIGIPLETTDRRKERMAKACLAVGKIKRSFSEAISVNDGAFSRTRDIIEFENACYGESISPGSYDDVRRKDLRLLVEAGIVVSSSSMEEQATNNPSRGYALSLAFANLLKKQGMPSWNEDLSEYAAHTKSLKEELERKRDLQMVSVTLPNGERLELTYGEHNELQKAIIEEFLPRFGMEAEVLYVGDTKKKFLYIDRNELNRIHVFELEHDELPDVIAFSRDKNLLYLIEAFHSTGEWNEIRVKRIKKKLNDSGCSANVVFFTAFENRDSFRKKAKDIAWETEVWIADSPEHLVHFNGYKFLEINK